MHSYVTAPCIEECPSKVDVPRYIDYIKDGKFTHSVGVVLQKYPMAATCGRVCVRFCEMACRRTQVDEAVGIKVLKRFVADWAQDHLDELKTNVSPATGRRVAIVGSGPAGLSCAYQLARRGYQVTMFESLPKPGGMLRYGIPQYRLPRNVLDAVLTNDFRIEDDAARNVFATVTGFRSAQYVSGFEPSISSQTAHLLVSSRSRKRPSHHLSKAITIGSCPVKDQIAF